MEFDEYAAFLGKAVQGVRPALLKDMTKLGEIQTELAKREIIGHEVAAWQPLADATIAEKQRLGFTGHVSGSDPLLRTGTLRDSIEFEIEPNAVAISLVLGSHDKVALFQELGTATIPPRPFLATATLQSLPEAAEILGRTAADLLTPKA